MSSNDLALIKINSLQELEKIANSMVRSNMFGVKTFDQAFSLMMISNARGIHPVKAAMDYHIIQGRPALKADAMLAYFQESGGVVQWPVYTQSRVVGLFSHPKSGQIEPVEVEWTLEMASKIMTRENGKTIPLTDKEVWKSYPRGMLRSRCISEGVRTVYPGIISGIYTDEEVEAFSEKERFNKARSVEVKVEETNAEMSHITGEVLPVVHTEAAATSKNFTLPEGITEEMYIALRDKFIEDATILKEKAIKNAHDVQILYLIRKDWYALCNGYMCKNDWFLPPLKVVNTMQDLVAGMQVRSIAKGHITYIDGCSTSLDDEINSMDYQQSAVLDSERQAGLNNDAADTLEHEIN